MVNKYLLRESKLSAIYFTLGIKFQNCVIIQNLYSHCLCVCLLHTQTHIFLSGILLKFKLSSAPEMVVKKI